MIMKSLLGGTALLASVTLADVADLETSITQGGAIAWLADSLAIPQSSVTTCAISSRESVSCQLPWHTFLR